MEGIEKITAKIAQDAKAEIDALAAQTGEKLQELRDSAQAEHLLRQVSAQRGGVRIWLGNAAGAAGLRAFLSAAGEAEDRCLALTETLP